jgi:hypothetical protein
MFAGVSQVSTRRRFDEGMRNLDTPGEEATGEELRLFSEAASRLRGQPISVIVHVQFRNRDKTRLWQRDETLTLHPRDGVYEVTHGRREHMDEHRLRDWRSVCHPRGGVLGPGLRSLVAVRGTTREWGRAPWSGPGPDPERKGTFIVARETSRTKTDESKPVAAASAKLDSRQVYGRAPAGRSSGPSFRKGA